MKIRLLTLFSLFPLASAIAQCGGTIPPPGLTYVYGIDTDNDGFAVFDMQHYIEQIDRPEMESFFGISSSAYNVSFKDRSMAPLPLLYTNTVQNEECSIEYIYSGSGAMFEEQPPCYWPVFIYLGKSLRLITVPFDGDYDNDGILNSDEDTNQNRNMMDDDDDRDGIVNLIDNFNNLSIDQHTNIEVSLFPNPITDGLLNLRSNAAITSVAIFDLAGKQLMEAKVTADFIDVNRISAGIYLSKLESEKGTIYRKIVIN